MLYRPFLSVEHNTVRRPRPGRSAANDPATHPLRAGGGLLDRAVNDCLTRVFRSFRYRLFVAVGALHPLVAFLRFYCQRRDRPCLETPDADGLVGFPAISVSPAIDARQRRIDLRNQLAFAVARPQFDGAFGFQ